MAEKVLGRFRRGRFPDVFLDAAADLMNVQLTKVHESEHRILEYSSSYGLFLTGLLMLSREDSVHHPVTAELDEIVGLLHEAEFHVQEGCATFLTLNVCLAGFGNAAADRLAERMPPDYRAATALVSDCLSSTRGNSTLGPLVVKNMEFLVHGICLAALNSGICTEFPAPDAMTVSRLRSYLKVHSPAARLMAIREYLSNRQHAEAYVQFCADAALRAVGDLPLYDQHFMRAFMSQHPLEWEERHRHLEFEMRRDLVGWLARHGSVDIDPTYVFSFSDLSRWSPVVSLRAWEAQLGVSTGVVEALQSISETPIERHVAVVHSVGYRLEDSRRVLVSSDRARPSQALVRIGSKVRDVVARVIYLPVGNDFSAMGIEGNNRLIVDLALYRGIASVEATLRVDAISIADALALVPHSMSCCFMTSAYNYNQLQADATQDRRTSTGFPLIHVFFVPGEFDLVAHIRSSSSPFVLRHSLAFRVPRDWAEDVELPGVIELEEQLPGAKRTYFCIADKMLLGSYRELLARQPRVQDGGASVSDRGRRCAIEACYGFDSVLERSATGVYEV